MLSRNHVINKHLPAQIKIAQAGVKGRCGFAYTIIMY